MWKEGLVTERGKAKLGDCKTGRGKGLCKTLLRQEERTSAKNHEEVEEENISNLSFVRTTVKSTWARVTSLGHSQTQASLGAEFKRTAIMLGVAHCC